VNLFITIEHEPGHDVVQYLNDNYMGKYKLFSKEPSENEDYEITEVYCYIESLTENDVDDFIKDLQHGISQDYNTWELFFNDL
jgi:hypothetical protein